jgi:hypothetical protein
MKWFLKFFSAKNKDIDVFSDSVEPQIKESLKRREKEIESLKLYDRGEKTIHAPDIKNIV